MRVLLPSYNNLGSVLLNAEQKLYMMLSPEAVSGPAAL
jgi:hypothetical protein